MPLQPSELRRLTVEGARAARTRARRRPATPAGLAAEGVAVVVPDRLAGPVAPERFGVLQSLLAYLLTACGESARE